jgi:hypothetical protein
MLRSKELDRTENGETRPCLMMYSYYVTVQAEPFVVHTLKMLGDLVENILNEVTQTKKVPSTCKEIQNLLNISK